MGAAGAEAAAEAAGPVGPATSRGQAAGESLEMVLSSPLFGVGRCQSLRREGRIPCEALHRRSRPLRRSRRAPVDPLQRLEHSPGVGTAPVPPRRSARPSRWNVTDRIVAEAGIARAGDE